MSVATREMVPELLDQLPADDAAAIHSRLDLRRINWLMRNAATIARACRQHWHGTPPQRWVDLGAGDGAVMTAVEQWLAPQWPGVAVTLVDQTAVRPRCNPRTWRAEFVCAEATGWLRALPPGAVDVTVANLFLHHFAAGDLQNLLAGIARTTRLFVACEPRRSGHALAGCGLLGLLGCNRVTRHDARVSVRAGFAGRELSALWPAKRGWQLIEGSSAWFSHLFVARRS
jgi:hypothetical protein